MSDYYGQNSLVISFVWFTRIALFRADWTIVELVFARFVEIQRHR